MQIQHEIHALHRQLEHGVIGGALDIDMLVSTDVSANMNRHEIRRSLAIGQRTVDRVAPFASHTALAFAHPANQRSGIGAERDDGALEQPPLGKEQAPPLITRGGVCVHECLVVRRKVDAPDRIADRRPPHRECANVLAVDHVRDVVSPCLRFTTATEFDLAEATHTL